MIQDASNPSAEVGFSLPPVAQLEGLLARLGVSNDTEVVLYSSGHIMWATRAWWLLRYCGHRQRAGAQRRLCRLGAMAAIRCQPRRPAIPKGNFKAAPEPALIADKDGVLRAIGDAMACARSMLCQQRCTAGEADFGLGRKGHIAGSINLPYDDLLDGDRFKDGDCATRGAKRQGTAFLEAA